MLLKMVTDNDGWMMINDDQHDSNNNGANVAICFDDVL